MQEKSGGRPVVSRKEPRQQPKGTSQKKRDSFNDENKGKAWGSDEQVGGRRKEERKRVEKERVQREKEDKVVVPSRKSRFLRSVTLLKSSRYLKGRRLEMVGS